MTAKTIEDQIIGLSRSLSAVEESVKFLHERLTEIKRDNRVLFEKLEDSIEARRAESTETSTRMVLVEKDVADLEREIERGKGNRSALVNGMVAALISAIISVIGTILTTTFFKSK